MNWEFESVEEIWRWLLPNELGVWIHGDRGDGHSQMNWELELMEEI